MSPRVVPHPVLVPLEEVAAQMGGGTAETAAARLEATGLPAPVADWQGRPCVTPATAAKAVEGYRLEVEAVEAKRAAYDAYVADREQRRRAAGREAAEKAMRSAFEASRRQLEENFAAVVMVGASPRGSPGELSAGRNARVEAVEAFDRKNPIVPLERWQG